MQTAIDSTYQRFIGLVSGARKLPLPKVDEIAQGRVWDGAKAKELKLVDDFGTQDDAIAEAATQAKLDPKSVYPLYLEDQPSWLANLFAGLAAPDEEEALDPITRMARRQNKALSAAIGDTQRLLNGPAVQVRCLACPSEPSHVVRLNLFDILIRRFTAS